MKFRPNVAALIYKGILTSPIPLMSDWNMIKPKLKTNPAKMVFWKMLASSKMTCSTPSKRRMAGERNHAMVDSTMDTMTTMVSVCVATWFTILKFFAPAYWATRMVPAKAKPELREMSRKLTGKLIETAATALAPSLPTQKASTS